MHSIEGTIALVTCGGGGLGREVCRALAEAGADVVVSWRSSRERAEAAVAEVEALGRRGAAVALDQSDAASIEAGVAQAAQVFGRLDIVVNNAAVAKGVPFPDLDALTPEIWDWTMTANLRGPYLVARAAAPHLKASGRGRIVNVGAMAGLKPMGASIAQATSKAGLAHLTRCLAVALASEVTVNCVAPGLMEGTLLTANIPDAFRDGFASQAALGTTTDLSDVAGQIVQFCRADSVTGQTAVVDGGVFFH